MKNKLKFVMLLRIHTRPNDISKRFFKKIKRYGGSKRDFILLMGYHSYNRTALNFVNELIERQLIKPCNVNDNGNFDYIADYDLLESEIKKYPEHKSMDDFVIKPVFG